MKKKIVLITALLSLASISTHAADAKETWAKTCAKCHGVSGKGDTKQGKKLDLKDFADAAFQASFDDEKAFKAIKEGVKDGDKIRMKRAENLSDDEIKALVAYVRAFKK